MLFINFIFKNLFRNKKKFLLFILGFSIIFFILIFSFLSSESFKYQLNDECTISGDFIVEPTVDSDNIKFSFDGPSFNYKNPYPYNQSFLKYYFQSLKNISGVSNLFYIINEASEDYEVCNLFYVNSSDLSRLKLHMVDGKFFSNSSQVIIEKGFADEENLKVGENFSLKNKTFIVSGIFEGNSYFYGSIFLSLDNLNYISPYDVANLFSLSNSELISLYGDNLSSNSVIDNQIIFIGDLKDNVDKNSVKRDIDSIDENWTCVNSLDDFQDYKIISNYNNTLNFLIQVVVIILSSVVIIYNFISSWDDRIKDLSILSVIGWNNKKLLCFLLFESIFLVVLAGFIVLLILLCFANFYFYKGFECLNFGIFIKFFSTILCGVLIGSFYYVYKLFKLKPAFVLKAS